MASHRTYILIITSLALLFISYSYDDQKASTCLQKCIQNQSQNDQRLCFSQCYGPECYKSYFKGVTNYADFKKKYKNKSEGEIEKQFSKAMEEFNHCDKVLKEDFQPQPFKSVLLTNIIQLNANQPSKYSYAIDKKRAQN